LTNLTAPRTQIDYETLQRQIEEKRHREAEEARIDRIFDEQRKKNDEVALALEKKEKQVGRRAAKLARCDQCEGLSAGADEARARGELLPEVLPTPGGPARVRPERPRPDEEGRAAEERGRRRPMRTVIGAKV
jgi:hypothetical protein